VNLKCPIVPRGVFKVRLLKENVHSGTIGTLPLSSHPVLDQHHSTLCMVKSEVEAENLVPCLVSTVIFRWKAVQPPEVLSPGSNTDGPSGETIEALHSLGQ
jgi:hypothetical protein